MKVKAQCFDCYDNAVFQYTGQTGNFDPLQAQLDYVKGLKKPKTTIDCISCGRNVEYEEDKGHWKAKVV